MQYGNLISLQSLQRNSGGVSASINAVSKKQAMVQTNLLPGNREMTLPSEQVPCSETGVSGQKGGHS